MRVIRSLHKQNDYTLTSILKAVGFPKATYYYQLKCLERPDKDQAIKDDILAIREEHKDYGYRRVHAELRRRGYQVNKKKVHRLMKEMKLQVTSFTRKSRKYNSYKGDVGTIVPNLLNRRFKSSIPRQKILTDTTEFKYYETDSSGNLQIKKLYLDPFLNLFNLQIVSYKISHQPNKESMMEALKDAVRATDDCEFRRTFHSDQGWAYQMEDYQDHLKNHAIFQSMSRKGNCLDNSPMENFFGLMKQEIYYGKSYRSYEELKEAIQNYIRYYNENRIKEKLGWLSPVEYLEKYAS
ncbi:hypothetical protein CL176_09380 [Suicoccus acidiformans]|uniref:Integrase catalytic domain-containing protein n=1 Tax=Suicoccus acidiformans TaxID=2036206 RepID=A0A347WM86_9LACT|nr:hypothetical protein CL176_09380 [Suicoccus acidiformans]